MDFLREKFGGDNAQQALIGFVIAVLSLWLSFSIYRAAWPSRFKGVLIPLVLFLPILFFELFFIPNVGEGMPGFAFLYIIVLSIICYFIGLIIDLTKNKIKNTESYTQIESRVNKVNKITWKSVLIIILVYVFLWFLININNQRNRMRSIPPPGPPPGFKQIEG